MQILMGLLASRKGWRSRVASPVEALSKWLFNRRVFAVGLLWLLGLGAHYWCVLDHANAGARVCVDTPSHAPPFEIVCSSWG